MAPIRILQMIGSLRMGGSQAMIVNLYKNIDRDKIQFDFILDHNDEIDNTLVPIVKSLGAKIFVFPTFKGKNLIEIINAWNYFFKEHREYKIIHSHVRSYASIFLAIAKKYGLKTIIHSHSTSDGNGIIANVKHLLEYPLRYIADYFFSCSNEAGEWLFGRRIVQQNNYRILNNAIEAEKYRFNETIRREFRKKLSLSEKTSVYIHVGRFHILKNHKFLLNVFKEIKKRQPDSVLLLMGEGNLRADIEKQISVLQLTDSVRLLGTCKDVFNWMQAADCMLFPSLTEGLGIVAIEAQAAGLPCICSMGIPKAVAITDLCYFLELDVGKWVDEAIKLKSITRKDYLLNIIASGYDINSTANSILEFYLKLQRS